MPAPEIKDLSFLLPINPNKKAQTRQACDIKKLVFHHTERDWDVLFTARYHINRNHISDSGCPTICYHYFIDRNGKIYKTVDEHTITWHVGKWNRESVGIVFDYPGGSLESGMEMLKSGIALGRMICNRFNIPVNEIYGHRELPETGFVMENGCRIYRKECPGWLIDMDYIRHEIEKHI